MSTATYDLHALIKETRRRARQRRWAYSGVLALLAGAGIWGALALTGGSGAIPAPPVPPGYHLVKARGDVEHALLAFSERGAENGYPLGKLGKGVRFEVWLDRKAGLVRTRGRWPVGRFSDETGSCAPSCATSVPLLQRYWPVDTTKFVRRPGFGIFRGRHVIWLGVLEHGFAPAYRNGEWIALDPWTHDAVGDRTYATTEKPAGEILSETWVVRRFPDIAANRFWFPLKDAARTVDVQSVEFAPVPLDLPGRLPPPDLRHAAGVVVGRLGQATIFAGRRRGGSWRIFRVGKDGTVGGGGWRRSGPNTLRVGIDWGGQSGPFNGRAYLVFAGGMLAEPSTKLYLRYAGFRRRLRLNSVGASVASRFDYFVFPRGLKIRRGTAVKLEVLRGSRVIAGPSFSPPYYPSTKSFVPPYPDGTAKQPGPKALHAALRQLGL